MIIGITGTDGAGKGTVVSYLVKELGFTHFSSRELIVREIAKRGLEVTRENMRIVANDMRKEHGTDVMVTKSLEKISEEHIDDSVIESIRTLKEAETLKANGGILLSVDADQQIRYDRILARQSESDHVTFEEFKTQEELEMNDPDPNGMQKAKVIEMADYTIFNDNDMRQLHEDIEAFLEKCKPRTIEKSAWFCVRDKKVLFARSKNNPEVFYLPGGKREEGETDEEALVREIKEETTVDIEIQSIKPATTITHHAHGKPANVSVQLTAFFADYSGELTPSDEIVELAWFDSSDINKVYGVGVKTLHWLKKEDLIN